MRKQFRSVANCLLIAAVLLNTSLRNTAAQGDQSPTLDRLMSPEVLEALGVRVEDGKVVETGPEEAIALGLFRSFAKNTESEEYFAIVENASDGIIAVPILEMKGVVAADGLVAYEQYCEVCQPVSPVPGGPEGPDPAPLPSPFVPSPFEEVRAYLSELPANALAQPQAEFDGGNSWQNLEVEDIREFELQLEQEMLQ